ncbi:MAG TPA: hypothetical protein VGP82_22600 [Ktedonobacterales bacterium]|nr:hypothetical protein [Ktedonobacterales bacterium]
MHADPLPLGHRKKSPDDWYGYLNMMEADAVNRSPKQTSGEAIAEIWFTNFPANAEAKTLG